MKLSQVWWVIMGIGIWYAWVVWPILYFIFPNRELPQLHWGWIPGSCGVWVVLDWLDYSICA